MFVTACFYALEIGTMHYTLEGVSKDFHSKDQHAEEDLQAAEQTLWAQDMAPHSQAVFGNAKVQACWLFLTAPWRSEFFSSRKWEIRSKSAFKVLRFHFMARNELLGSQKFEWASYLSKTMDERIESQLDINWKSWVITGGLIAAFIPLQLEERHALYFFLALGWVLLLAAWLLRRWSEEVIDWLVIKGHQHRRAAEYHHQEALRSARARSKWGGAGLLGKVLALRAQENGGAPPLNFTSLVKAAAQKRSTEQGFDCDQVWPSLAQIRATELRIAIETKKAATVAQKVHDSMGALKDDPEAEAHLKPGWRLLSMPVLLQIVKLLQCMHQALMLTMLGRQAIVHFGVGLGMPFLVAMWLPTTLNSLLVTPHVLKNIALTGAVVETNHGVLELMEKEFEQSGDYSAASQALELMVQSKLSEDDMKDADLVRAKVHDMAKLGEMKWRYRVVDEGQSPRDEAIRILTEVRGLDGRTHPFRLAPVRGPSRPGTTRAPRPTPTTAPPSRLL